MGNAARLPALLMNAPEQDERQKGGGQQKQGNAPPVPGYGSVGNTHASDHGEFQGRPQDVDSGVQPHQADFHAFRQSQTGSGYSPEVDAHSLAGLREVHDSAGGIVLPHGVGGQVRPSVREFPASGPQ